VVPTTDRDLSGCTLGRYRLHERIGAGGFGTVYRGEQPQLGRDVVVKVLHRQLQLDDDALRRFLREARLASRLDHPYAAHVYAFGVEDEDGLAWIAMELVQGVTLKHWLATHGPMTLEQFVPFFERIAEVVQAAHERGIVHRDLKPSNVMVIEGTDGLIPKLLDFGIAKSLPAAPAGVVTTRMRAKPSLTPSDPVNGPAANNGCITPSNAVMGSWPYMPPEQWWNYAVGPAADTYALGVLAYEALTGQVPFFAETRYEYLERHIYGDVPGVGWPALDQIFQRALAKYPRERHGSVLELASELRAVLRASQGAQLRSSAQRWEDRGRPPGLLWGGDMLADLEVPSDELGEPACSFVAASQRGARRVRWIRRSLVAIAVASLLAVVEYRAATKTWTAQQLVTQAEHTPTRPMREVREHVTSQQQATWPPPVFPLLRQRSKLLGLARPQRGAQLRCQLQHVAMAIFGSLGERTLKDPVELRREVIAERRHRCIAVVRVSGQGLVGDDAERMDIGCPSHPGIAAGEPVDPEAEQLGDQTARALDHHHVRGLQVEMFDPSLVRGLDHLRDALEERHEPCERHRPVRLQPALERDALHQLHRNPGQVVLAFDPEGVDMSRVRMIEP
jgi:serine/threonine protein kinase